MKKEHLPVKSLIWLSLFIVFMTEAGSQPYVDPVQIRYTYAFRNSHGDATPFIHFWAGTDIPVKLKENTYLLLSPYFEQWRIDSAEKEKIMPLVQSVAFPVGLILPVHDSRWTLNVVPVVRWNGEKPFSEKTFQFGSALFASWARKPEQKFRLGIYLNNEFFGLFVMPLFGTDWRIDDRNYLFGLLPGRLTYEHQWSKNIYGGFSFRAITNSYRLKNGQYLRLDDNQLSAYMDLYLLKNLCITIEPGYGIIRKMRTGINNRKYFTDRDFGDGPFIKLSCSYRVRF